MPAVPDEELLYEIDDLVRVSRNAVITGETTHETGQVVTTVGILTASGQRVYIYEVECGVLLEDGFEPDDSVDLEWYGAGELQPYEAPEHPQPAE